MKKIHLVLQRKFREEDFGGIAPAPSLLMGVYTSKKEAEDAIKSLPEPKEFHAQYGSGMEEYFVVKAVLGGLCNIEL